MTVRDVQRGTRLRTIVDAPQRLQKTGIKTLDADGKPVDATGTEGSKFFGFKRAGIGFECDFGSAVERQQATQIRQQAVQPGG